MAPPAKPSAVSGRRNESDDESSDDDDDDESDEGSDSDDDDGDSDDDDEASSDHASSAPAFADGEPPEGLPSVEWYRRWRNDSKTGRAAERRRDEALSAAEPAERYTRPDAVWRALDERSSSVRLLRAAYLIELAQNGGVLWWEINEHGDYNSLFDTQYVARPALLRGFQDEGAFTDVSPPPPLRGNLVLT